MATNRPLVGRAAVAHELRVSEKTVSRLRKAGRLEVKSNGRTSPWVVDRDALAKLKCGLQQK